MTRLSDLSPVLCSLLPDTNRLNTSGVTLQDACAVEFDCPGCGEHRIFAPFQGKWRGGGAKWAVMGDSLENLTFYDTAQGSRSIRVLSHCKSHFNIVGGTIEFYDDSGHRNYRSEKVMQPVNAEISGPTEPESAAAEVVFVLPTVPAILFDEPLTGFGGTVHFQYLNGILCQRYDNPHRNDQPAQIWVKVPGTPYPPGFMQTVEAMIAARVSAEVGSTRVSQQEQNLRSESLQRRLEERQEELATKAHTLPTEDPNKPAG